MGLAVRTVFVWRHRFAEHRVDGLKDEAMTNRGRSGGERGIVDGLVLN